MVLGFDHACRCHLGAVVGFGTLANQCLVSFGTPTRWHGVWGCQTLSVWWAWFGIWQLPIIVFIAAALGMVAGIIIQRHRGKASAFAFGPYLIMAAWVVLLFGEYIQAYIGIR